MTNDYKENYFKVESNFNWDEYFLLQAMIASFKSKDPSTKVGCVIVDKNNHQVTMGYNGMVAGIDEGQLPWGKIKTVPLEHQKYAYVVHAETNAILHTNISLEDCKAYVTLFPCNECAKLIASKKINEVIYLSDKHRDLETNKIAKKIFKLAGIKYRTVKMDESHLERLNQHLTHLITDT
ncbi:MAG: dCMP deaminase family protein [Bacteriovoracaceae bacterium]|jgi:dCMP deaminase|nr:dCMP deaminase family protein [Bacteriovoracaceae bacterium]